MVKILTGLTVAAVVAAGGWFGFEFYVQHRVAGEVEAAFAQIRTAGGKASHGKVSFDLWSRTVAIADIAVEPAAAQPLSLKIARFTAFGVSQPEPTRFAAASIEATDVEVGGSISAQPGWHLAYKTPRIVVKDYSGPARPPRPPVSSSPTDVWLAALEQFATVTASSVTAPSAVGTFDQGAAGSADYSYSDLALRDIKNGRIASLTIERMAFTADLQVAGKTERHTGEAANIALYDVDTSAVAAMLDQSGAGDDEYHRLYRQMASGAYSITSADGPRIRMDAMTCDDVAVRPSRMQLAALMAVLPPSGTQPTPAQTRAMMEKVAGAYQGLRIGNAEIRGITVETPEGPFKLAVTRFNMEDGKIGEFALEGLDAHSQQGPVKVGRFALKSFDIANLLRMSSQFAAPAAAPSPDQLFALLPLLEGAEVTGVVAPYKDSTAPVNIEKLDVHWGQFVGPIPSQARLSVKMSAPIVATNPALKTLVAAGIDSAAIKLDFGAAWTESSHTLVLDPAMAELGGVLSATARVSLGNVPRGVFSTNALQAAIMAAQIEAGTMEIVVRDIGGVDLAVADYARTQNISPETARQAIASNARTSGAAMAATNPDAATIAEALARFIENPRGTLAIKLTPQGRVSALQLLAALKTDPLTALARFQVEASTGR